MTKLCSLEDNPDCLEITSLGSLYAGPWDKKYWSSSRGKDRYPYPVGYQAVRAHNGSTYKTEIHEGPKGPLFMIISADGESSSGQTPDITWEKFQKKYCLRVKILPGKRFSCKIDGVEFFGFKNPYVRRLLREMVANVSESAEQNLLSSGSRKEVPRADDVSCNLDASTSHDLQPYSDRPKVSGKRSKKMEIKKTAVTSNKSLKRSRSQNLIKDDQSIRSAVKSLHYSKEDCDGGKNLTVVPQSLKLVTVKYEKDRVTENEPPSNDMDISKKQKSQSSAEEKRVLSESQCCATTGAENLATTGKPLDRLQGTEVEDFPCPIELVEKEKELKCVGDTQALNGVGFAPDTLDVDQGTQETTNNKFKEHLYAEDLITSNDSVTEAHLEDVTDASNSNPDSGKSDFDSVGQETAKSMMSFLLPQAIPLLKRTSRRKKSDDSLLEVPSSGVNYNKENTENYTASLCTVLRTDCIISDMKEQRNVKILNAHSSNAVKSDALSKVVGNICEDRVPYVEALSSADGNAEPCISNKCGLSSITGNHYNSLDCCLEAIGSKEIFSINEVHINSSVMRQCGDVSEEFNDAAMSLVENSEDSLDRSNENDTTLPDSINFDAAVESINDVELKAMFVSSNVQLEEARMQAETAKAGTVPFIQSPALVYSRRKRVQTKSQTTGKYNVPLSESIICRSSGDGYVSDSCPTTGNSITLEIAETNPLHDKSYKEGLTGALGKSKSLTADTPKINSNTQQNNLVLNIKQNQSFTYASKDLETTDNVEHSDSQVQNFTVHDDKEMVALNNLSVPNSPESCQKKDTRFFKSSSFAMEFQHDSDFKPKSISIRKDFLGKFKQVGCYNHPFPVLSLMVCTGSTEIYICVVCDLPADKNATLLMYKVEMQEPTLGTPTFLGHSPITLPSIKDYFGREISVERSGLQFTPEGQSLVSLDSIKMPYCRQSKISCLCSTCASTSFEGDTVKIVKVNFGFVTIIAKLKAVEMLQCTLVCEPNYLVGVGESGRLHLWAMNSAWSEHTQKFTMPSNDIMSPGIVELKKVPKCNSLVVGHNGFGEFSLWDISKQTFVSKFSGSSSSVCDFLPIGLFRWNNYGKISSDQDVNGLVNRMIASTNAWFSEQTSDHYVPPFEDNVAVWLLISASSESDSQHDYMSQDYQTKSAGLWRLALLVKNTVLLGNTLDPSAVAIGASSGHGIIGTSDGLVYVWEMATGVKLGTLHQYKGKAVSCIATDDSKKGAIAIAGGDSQLLVYLPS